MPTRPLPTDLPVHSFPTAVELETFLSECHTTSSGFWLKLAKKTSGVPSVNLTEAIEIALCYGWINGQGLGIDDTWYLARYTPRRPKSMWSKVNVKLVRKLEEQGRMRPAGTAAVEAAKEDGRWNRAYAGPATITVPEDLTQALATNSTAAAFFEGLNKTDRYAVLWRIETASPQNRAKRVNAMVQMLTAGNVPGKSASSPKTDKAKKVDLEGDQSRKVTRPAATLRKVVEKESARQPRRPGLRPRS